MVEKRVINKYDLDQEVYVVTGNKLVLTSVTGFKKNNNDVVEYSLSGFPTNVRESLIFKDTKSCFKYLEEHIATPESIPKKLKTGIDSIKGRFFKK